MSCAFSLVSRLFLALDRKKKAKKKNMDEKKDFFEGIEKRIEFWIEDSTAVDLREAITRKSWDDILQEAKCSILSSIQNQECDAYLLSESSLFVWKDHFLLKTCGKTTPLSCIDPILRLLPKRSSIALFYCHQQFRHPEDQPCPHSQVDLEKALFELLVQTAGGSYTYKTHENKFDAFIWINNKNTITPMKTQEVSTRILSKKCLQWFEKKQILKVWECLDSKVLVDEFWFTPQGYSANILGKDLYLTIHLTPQQNSCYLSIESNTKDFSRLISNCF